jgi:hypothetical protein
MKNTIAILALSAATAYTGFSQGEIQFLNGNKTQISVNSALGGAATSTSTAGTGLYYYALFSSVASTSVANVGTAAEIPTTGTAPAFVFSDNTWTFDNDYGTSTASAGKLQAETLDSNGYTQIPGSPASAQFVVIGWSANIGSTLTSVESWLAGADGAELGYIGESAVSGSFGTGNGSPGSTATPGILFSPTAPALAGFTLGQFTPSPEPSTIALGVMGACSLLALRRKKA